MQEISGRPTTAMPTAGAYIKVHRKISRLFLIISNL